MHAPRRVRRCRVDTAAVEANRSYDIFIYLRKGKDALVGVAVITHRRVRPPVCASRTETWWKPAGMDGGRAGRDADAGGRGSFCALFSGTLLCLLLKLKPGTDNRTNPPPPLPARTCSLREVNKQSRKIKARRRKCFCSLTQLNMFNIIVRHHYKTRPFICILQKKQNTKYK